MPRRVRGVRSGGRGREGLAGGGVGGGGAGGEGRSSEAEYKFYLAASGSKPVSRENSPATERRANAECVGSCLAVTLNL